MESSHQLAAIMFTDIVGYTSLMGKDEARAMELVERNNDVQRQIVEKHNGRLHKDLGDGSLVSFGSAIEAVICALEIQESIRDDQDLILRIGIHLGDVTFKENDVFGDGVNIASRIESIADPGGIYISESVQKAIRGRSDIHTVYLGELELKNVDYAVKTYALRGEGLPRPRKTSEKHLTGRLWAEIRRRNVHRAALTYLAFAFILLSIRPWVLEGYETILYIVLSVGLPISLFLSWRFERSPMGFISVTSRKSWENPFSDSQKKPFTSNTIIITLLIIIIGVNVIPKFLDSDIVGHDTEAEKSIAVMAFRDMSPEGDQQYFAEGVAEEILNSLARIPGLKVAARTSSFRFGTENVDLQEVGTKLGVSTVLEGSIRKQGDQLRVTAQLISVESGFHIWTDQFDGRGDDIFSIQEDIAQTIADNLKVTFHIGKDDQKRLTESSEAYESYLKGLFYLNRRSLSDAQQYFDDAVSIDPGFSLAYAGLADVYNLLGIYGLRPPKEMGPKVKEAADKALALNSTIAEAYTSLGFYYMFHERDYEAANTSFQKSLELNPNYIQAYGWYGIFLAWIEEDYETALSTGKTGVILDPLNPLAYTLYTTSLIAAGRFQQAEAAAGEAIALYENMYLASLLKGVALMRLGEYSEGIAQIQSAERIWDRHHWAVGFEAWAQAEAGNVKAAKQLLLELEKRSQSEYISGYTKGIAAAAIGDLDLAYEYFDEAVQQRDGLILGIKTSYLPPAARNHPRYQEILEKLGLSQ